MHDQRDAPGAHAGRAKARRSTANSIAVAHSTRPLKAPPRVMANDRVERAFHVKHRCAVGDSSFRVKLEARALRSSVASDMRSGAS